MSDTLTDIPQFQSFIMTGYECTAAQTEIRERLDMLKATRHDEYCRIDYTLAKELGVTTVREGLSWHFIDRGGTYDFSRYEHMLRIGSEEGVEQIWDLNHFDFPGHLDPFSEKFVDSFVEYALRAWEMLRKHIPGTLYIVPVNEISFFSWIGADRGVWAPYKTGRENGFRFKQQLVRAAIAAMRAIWKEDRGVRFIHTDPFMRRVAIEPALSHAKAHAHDFNEIVRFEAWDMISGRTFPELGGSPELLDIVGINYYFHNQEKVLSRPDGSLGHEAMEWDSRLRVSFADMVKLAVERYGRPVLVSETGSFGDLRYKWWKRLLSEVEEAFSQGLPLCGVCAYPAVDRPDTVNFLFRQSGLWDFEDNDPACIRIPHRRTLRVIHNFIQQSPVTKVRASGTFSEIS